MNGKWRYGWLFPLVLAALLGGLSAWLGRISEIRIEEAALNPDEPQYRMRGIDGRQFDGSGLIAQHLRAESAWQLPESDDVSFDTLTLQVYENGRRIYQAASRSARYNTESRQIELKNQVVLDKAPADGQAAGELKTEHLIIDTVGKLARTDAAVTYRYGESNGTAQGLTYNYQQGLLNLPARVKATIYVPKNPS
ncbi:LPS export ABC transporter periplasmic protein LptC [Neisseria leonii]|uniref:LPS export ABC transporter periplasmic protein LptC n=1 Tax=Neisseria leonii TaxID=2995413 RepID=A0A9X4E4R2_9NEIS|nr:LPS export ABC transporter periplasmic protein LptC [Neisseria sp. 51.81]MDD9327946.1 LPS export ABC transporter periplasmic protein LptC [Neisseria sp. 51.81]